VPFARQLLDQIEFPYDAGLAEAGLVDKLQIMNNRLLDDHRTLPVPTSVLIDTNGRLAAIYKGAVKVDQVMEDVDRLALKGAERHRVTQPFPGQRLGKWHGHRAATLAVRLREDGFLDDAIEYTSRNKELMSRDADYHKILTDLGTSLLEQDRATEAGSFYQAALRVRPEYANAYDGLARASEALGQHEAAISNYRRALELAPEMGYAHLKLAVLLLERSNKQEALQHFQDGTRIAPDYAPGHVGLGKLLAASGQMDAAVQSFRRASELDPQLTAAHIGLGLVFIRLGRPQDGVAAIRRAVELNPDDAKVNYQFAAVLEATGNTDEALQRYRQTLQIDGAFSDANLRLAVLLDRLDDKAAAVGHYRSRLQQVPDDVMALNNLAKILVTHPDQQVRNGAEAVRLARRAVQATAGRRPEVLSTLAAAYAEVGQLGQAI